MIGLISGIYYFGRLTIKDTNEPTPLSTDTSYDMGVLVLKYFPLDDKGSIDVSVTGDVAEPYEVVKKRTDDVTNQLKISLEKSTTYLGYKNPNAKPALRYHIVDTKEYQKEAPFDPNTRRMLYNKIMKEHNMCDYVDNKGVREVWIWAYQGPSVFPNPEDPTNPDNKLSYLGIWESTMSTPTGVFAANGADENMPVCQKTYFVYTFNYSRYTAEALESWGHQIEAEMDAIDKTLFRDKFMGPPYPQSSNQIGRCGSVHNPPNAREEYDRNNPTPQKSDCLDWNPDSLGTLSDISCNLWGCEDKDPISDNAALNYQIWMFQNMPGRGNTKTYQGKPLRNWWDIHGDFDNVMKNNKKMTL